MRPSAWAGSAANHTHRPAATRSSASTRPAILAPLKAALPVKRSARLRAVAAVRSRIRLLVNRHPIGTLNASWRSAWPEAAAVPWLQPCRLFPRATGSVTFSIESDNLPQLDCLFLFALPRPRSSSSRRGKSSFVGASRAAFSRSAIAPLPDRPWHGGREPGYRTRARLGVEAERLVVVGDRPLQVALGTAGDSPVVEGLRVLGVEAKRLVVVGDRPLRGRPCHGGREPRLLNAFA